MDIGRTDFTAYFTLTASPLSDVVTIAAIRREIWVGGEPAK